MRQSCYRDIDKGNGTKVNQTSMADSHNKEIDKQQINTNLHE